MTERLHFHFPLPCIGEGNGNPLQCSCLENPRDREAWKAAVHGVAQSWTRLKWLSSSREVKEDLHKCRNISCLCSEDHMAIFNMAILADFSYSYSSNALSSKTLATTCQINWHPDSEIHMWEERAEISQSNFAEETDHLTSICIIELQQSIQHIADIKTCWPTGRNGEYRKRLV